MNEGQLGINYLIHSRIFGVKKYDIYDGWVYVVFVVTQVVNKCVIYKICLP